MVSGRMLRKGRLVPVAPGVEDARFSGSEFLYDAWIHPPPRAEKVEGTAKHAGGRLCFIIRQQLN